jgi:hypothetical protein
VAERAVARTDAVKASVEARVDDVHSWQRGGDLVSVATLSAIVEVAFGGNPLKSAALTFHEARIRPLRSRPYIGYYPYV